MRGHRARRDRKRKAAPLWLCRDLGAYFKADCKTCFNDFDPIEDTESFARKMWINFVLGFNDFDPIEDTESL